MDLANEVGGGVADVALDIFIKQLVPRALSREPIQLTTRVGDEPPVETDIGRFVKLLASELSSPDQNVRSQVRLLVGLFVLKFTPRSLCDVCTHTSGQGGAGADVPAGGHEHHRPAAHHVAA